MKNIFKIKDILFQTFLYSTIVCIVSFLISIPLFFAGFYQIPIGLSIGLLINGLSYLFSYLIKEKEERERTVKYTIIINAVRFAVLVTCVIIFAVLEYKFKILVANSAAIAGGYMLTIFIQIGCAILEGKRNVRRKN